MPLTVGDRFAGHFEVTGVLGAGGMGEVYRARDTRLNRDVALKLLPDAFAADRDRLARFQREAELLASLNHPNIAQIHGVEEDGGVRALVLELAGEPAVVAEDVGSHDVRWRSFSVSRTGISPRVAGRRPARPGGGRGHLGVRPR